MTKHILRGILKDLYTYIPLYLGVVFGYIILPYLMIRYGIESNSKTVDALWMLMGVLTIYSLPNKSLESKMHELGFYISIYIGMILGYIIMPYSMSLLAIGSDSRIYHMFFIALGMLIINLVVFYCKYTKKKEEGKVN
jgi:hypothetical protein